MSSSLLPNQTKDSYDRSLHLSFSSLFNSRILFENILCVHKATDCPTILTLRSFGNQAIMISFKVSELDLIALKRNSVKILNNTIMIVLIAKGTQGDFGATFAVMFVLIYELRELSLSAVVIALNEMQCQSKLIYIIVFQKLFHKQHFLTITTYMKITLN